MEVLLPLLLSLPPGAMGVIGVALGLAIVVTSIMFMAAYFFQSPPLVALAREELAALVFTIFILFFWFGCDTILNSISSNLVLSSLSPEFQSVIQEHPCISGQGAQCQGGLTASHIQLSLASLKVMEEKLLDQYKDLYLFEALIGFLSTVSFPIASPFPAVAIISFSLAPFTGLTMLSNAHTVVVEAIGYLITVMWAKEFILIFTRDALPLLLLPLGLVFRAIPFYRRTGSSIIAVAFAMYFVLPFSMMLTNYMIFDVYKPADFAYTPMTASMFGTTRNATDVKGQITDAQDQGKNILTQFQGKDLIDDGLSNSRDCSGGTLSRLLCSFGNIAGAVYDGVTGFFRTVFNIWKFMMGMTGDFGLTWFNNPALPASSSAGLFYFLIQEVMTVSPFIILVTVSTVFEIIFTITMYRNVSVLLGGEAELVGVTKVI
jgi:hypothetical protein